MFTFPFHNYYHRRTTRSLRLTGSRFLGYLNTRTLAFAMFVALALLSNTHGKDSETSKSALPKAAKTEVIPSAFPRHLRDHKNLLPFYPPSKDKERSLLDRQ